MPRPPMLLLIACSCLAASILNPLAAQNLEIAGGAGYGILLADDFDRSGVGGPAVSIAAPAGGRHKVQFDYFFADVSRFSFNSHFLTVSYVLQKKSPGVRPFFQVGAGVEVQKFERPDFPLPPFVSFTSSTTNFALLLGGGVSIDAANGFFVRPEIRTYSVVGPAIYLMPMLSVGWRF